MNGHEVDLAIPPLPCVWIPTWPCNSITKHNFINVAFVLTGSVLGVFIRQQITLLIDLCHKEPLLINMDDFLQFIEPPIRFNLTHAIINPLLEICGSQTRVDGAGGALEKASTDIIVQCALGDPRNMQQTAKSLALGPGHAINPFGKAITGGLLLPSGPFLAMDDHWITIQDCLFVYFPDLSDGFVGFVAILKLNRLN
jgi:hypothetical protein